MRFSRLVTGGVVLFGVLCAAAFGAEQVVYVSPEGNDARDGRAADAGGGSGPVRTLERARDLVRDMRKGGAAGRVVVALRGGVYELPSPLKLDAQDSDTLWRAYEKETPIISGGRRLGMPAVGKDGRWRWVLPEVREEGWVFSQLFVDGKRRFRPRLPREGYYHVAGRLEPTAKAKLGQGDDRFFFRAGDIRADWRNRADIEVIAFHPWYTTMFRIEDVDVPRQIVTFTGRTRTPNWFGQLTWGTRYVVDNVAEALGDPGQWYLERRTGVLTYIPTEGEDPKHAAVVAPRHRQLVVIDGGMRPPYAKDIRFEGITFRHTAFVVPAEGRSVPQAAVTTPAALEARGVIGMAVADCRFAQLGGYGVEYGVATRDGVIENCRFADLGAGGIKLGTTFHTRTNGHGVTGHSVRRCVIAHGGRIEPAGVGIWIGQAAHSRVEHNTIADMYYTGISVGWKWGYGEHGAHHNVIARNHIHTIGQDVLSDMGGIYTLGEQPGTVLEGNVIHDVDCATYGGWGIYLDEGSSQIVVRDNLVYRHTDGGFNQHYGRENVVENNIFALGVEAQIGLAKPEEHLSFTFRRNIVAWNRGRLFRQPVTHDRKFAMHGNLLWAHGMPFDYGGMTAAQWREAGFGAGSQVADPRFAAPEKGDFRPLDGAAARAIGFKPFDVSGAGAGEAAAVDLAAYPRAFPPKGGPLAIEEGFELPRPGELACSGRTREDENAGTARISAAQAARGRQSLEFRDRAGKNAWNPHIAWEPDYQDAKVEGGVSIRWQRGAALTWQWRSRGHPYVTGPSLAIDADGRARAGDKDLGRVPAGQWVKAKVWADLREGKRGKWSLELTLPSGRVQRWDDLPCDAKFDLVGWVGVIADGNAEAVFHIDDVWMRTSE